MIIIGGGPAGASAAVYTARAKLKTLVLDKGLTAGALGMASKIANYPGVPDEISYHPPRHHLQRLPGARREGSPGGHRGCRLQPNEDAWILDVRSDQELRHEGEISGAHHIHITQLPLHTHEVTCDHPVYVFCGSGLRSMIAASLLQREGWENLTVVLGGLAGWNSVSCPLQESTKAK